MMRYSILNMAEGNAAPEQQPTIPNETIASSLENSQEERKRKLFKRVGNVGIAVSWLGSLTAFISRLSGFGIGVYGGIVAAFAGASLSIPLRIDYNDKMSKLQPLKKPKEE